MLHETILLTVPGGSEPTRLISYVPDNSPELDSRPRPALIVCPGGGYTFRSDREGEPVALRFDGAPSPSGSCWRPSTTCAPIVSATAWTPRR